jgi:hypothetical protein
MKKGHGRPPIPNLFDVYIHYLLKKDHTRFNFNSLLSSLEVYPLCTSVVTNYMESIVDSGDEQEESDDNDDDLVYDDPCSSNDHDESFISMVAKRREEVLKSVG